jgi:hypothetical protein
MRAIATCVLAVSFAAAAGPPARSVDLDRPGALDAIERQDKSLYQRIQGVLKAAEIEPCDTLPKLVQTRFRAGVEVCDGHAILTSFPAKIRVAFRIDETLYASNVVQPRITASAHPAVDGAATAARRR